MYNVVKKDGTIEAYDEQKIINACNKAARRAMYELSEKDYSKILNDVFAKIEETYDDDTDIEIYDMHNIVESVLEEDFPLVAKMYKEYRNYKKDLAWKFMILINQQMNMRLKKFLAISIKDGRELK